MNEYGMYQPMCSEKGVFAEFYDKVLKSDEVNDQGLPIFKTRTYIRIRTKDNPDIYDQPAGAEYKQRFHIEYNRYMMGKKDVQNGTPLNQFAFLSAEQIEACKFCGVFTVEKLVEMQDEQINMLNLGNECEAAKKFLAMNKNNKIIDEFEKKEKEYLEEIESLKNEIADLKEQIKDLRAAKKATKTVKEAGGE